VLSLAVAGCSAVGIGACDKQPDVTGDWMLSFTTSTAPTITAPTTVAAHFEQQPQTGFGLGRLVYGTLTAMDKSLFDQLTIPPLLHNDGSKTGVVLGCSMKVNVPIATPVSDDNLDQGPLRLALAGKIDAPGHMVDDGRSSVIAVDDTAMTMRSFAWTGAFQTK
jgi:hypothetical protein